MTTTIETTREQRKRARIAAGLNPRNTRPVEVIPSSNQTPELVGRGYYHTTLSGRTIVRHPNACGWPTWYHHSTLRVVVGEEWLRDCSSKGA